MNDVKKMEPEALKQSPQKKIVNTPLTPLPIAQGDTQRGINTDVGWIDLLKLWIKENLINDILNSQKGVVMNSKLWYASKTLWTNVILLLWAFVGPLVGIPTLDPELMAGLLGVVNLILRLITKGSVTLSN